MRSLDEFAGQWVVFDADHDVVASGATPAEALEGAPSLARQHPLVAAWVSPHPPYVALPHWPWVAVSTLAPGTVWLAGGPVRDLLLGREPGDWDFVVSRGALPLARAVANALSGDFYALDVERGTGRAIVPRPRDGRRVSLDFATLRGPTIGEDLQLRDFTINAMALSPDGVLIDPTGGAVDLQLGVIRLTHPASFRQDPARLLRAVRLAVELDFPLAPETAARLRGDAPTIQSIAAERTRDELIKVFSPGNASRGFQLLSDHGLLAHVLPEAIGGVPVGPSEDGANDLPWRDIPDRQGLLEIVSIVIQGLDGSRLPLGGGHDHQGLLAELDAVLDDFRDELAGYLRGSLGAGLIRSDLAAWCALFVCDRRSAQLGLHSAASAEGRLAELRFSARSRSFVSVTLRELWRFSALPPGALPGDSGLRRDIFRYFRAMGEAGVMASILSLAISVTASGPSVSPPSWGDDLARLRAVLVAYFRLRDEVIDPRPLLTGSDLLQMGFPESAELGQALAGLLEAQAAGRIRSETEARAWLARVKSEL